LKKIVVLFLLAAVLCTCRYKDTSGKLQHESNNGKPVSVLVFITGVVAGSPSYDMLSAGAQEFAGENSNVKIKIYEAGFNQAEWEEQLRSMVAEGEYDLVLGSNPSLPELCAGIGKSFPSQKFIILDAYYSGNPQILSYLYNQYEQALFLGYLAGLVTTGNMPSQAKARNAQKKIGFIAAQEFPLLTKQMVPGFLDGARLVDPDIELDFRVIGNWFDANKAADLAAGMINSGVVVFTSIAGGAAQGIVRAITERAYMVNFNTNDYRLAPGYIVGCGIMEQKKLTKEILSDFVNGHTQFGKAVTVGLKEGYLNFIFDDPGYYDYLPFEIQNKFASFMDDMYAGRIEYTVPPL
jgi:simple sugar transport system substrate-binding protein